jgi:hypothetical protein
MEDGVSVIVDMKKPQDEVKTQEENPRYLMFKVMISFK